MNLPTAEDLRKLVAQKKLMDSLGVKQQEARQWRAWYRQRDRIAARLMVGLAERVTKAAKNGEERLRLDAGHPPKGFEGDYDLKRWQAEVGQKVSDALRELKSTLHVAVEEDPQMCEDVTFSLYVTWR